MEYKPGALNPADFLSRHLRAAMVTEVRKARETEEYVRKIPNTFLIHERNTRGRHK